MTIWTMSPEITGPRLVMWLDTMTAIIEGTVFGGCGLLPGRVVQVRQIQQLAGEMACLLLH